MGKLSLYLEALDRDVLLLRLRHQLYVAASPLQIRYSRFRALVRG